MRRVFWHISGRFYEARSDRALSNYLRLKRKAEGFFVRLRGSA